MCSLFFLLRCTARTHGGKEKILKQDTTCIVVLITDSLPMSLKGPFAEEFAEDVRVSYTIVKSFYLTHHFPELALSLYLPISIVCDCFITLSCMVSIPYNPLLIHTHICICRKSFN